MDKVLLTVAEVSAATGMSRSKVYGLIASNELRSVKIGGSRRISPDDLADLIARNYAAHAC